MAYILFDYAGGLFNCFGVTDKKIYLKVPIEAHGIEIGGSHGDELIVDQRDLAMEHSLLEPVHLDPFLQQLS